MRLPDGVFALERLFFRKSVKSDPLSGLTEFLHRCKNYHLLSQEWPLLLTQERSQKRSFGESPKPAKKAHFGELPKKSHKAFNQKISPSKNDRRKGHKITAWIGGHFGVEKGRFPIPKNCQKTAQTGQCPENPASLT